jgi:hypothetical protein
MTREEKYDAVNSAETLDELADVINSFADEDGMIQGRTRKFRASKMAHACKAFGVISPNTLTREFGIRQQAFYINHYS